MNAHNSRLNYWISKSKFNGTVLMLLLHSLLLYLVTNCIVAAIV